MERIEGAIRERFNVSPQAQAYHLALWHEFSASQDDGISGMPYSVETVFPIGPCGRCTHDASLGLSADPRRRTFTFWETCNPNAYAALDVFSFGVLEGRMRWMMWYEYSSRKTAVRSPVLIALGVGFVLLAGCATEPRSCYEVVEHPEYGRQLRQIPCPAAEAQ
jgi:hypothetical protein